MHICQITSAFLPPEEGIGNYVNGLTTQFVKKGHSVTIITRGSKGKKTNENHGDIRIIRVPFIPLYPFYMQIQKQLFTTAFKNIESQCDIVHIHSPLCPTIPTSLPVVATIHTPMKADTQASFQETRNLRTTLWKLSGRFISYPLEKKLIQNVDTLTVVARSVAEELKDYPTAQKNIIVMANGIDSTLFTPAQRKTTEQYILFTGRLSYRKGLFDLLESARHICKKYPQITYKITGAGILSDELQRKIQDLDIANQVQFLGFVSREQLISLYQQATLYALPSHYEGLPTVLLEAMACGVPVVATAVSGNVDVITHGKNGLLVPPKTPEKLTEAISRVLDDETLKTTLGQNARKTIEEKYTWDIISDNYLTLYQSLLSS